MDFLQEYGYQLWNAAKESPITQEDVKRISPIVQARLDANFFDVLFDRISNRERHFLRAMAEFDQEVAIPTTEIAAKMGCAIGSVSPVRASLIGKGMIYSPSYGNVAYTVPMFADYMRRTMPLEKRDK